MRKTHYFRTHKGELTFDKFFNSLLPSKIGISYDHYGINSFHWLYGGQLFHNRYNRKAGFLNKIGAICPECGMPFVYDNIITSKALKHFCSYTCRSRYYGRQERELRIKKIIKNTDFTGYNEWRNIYDKYAYKLINDFYPEYKSAIIDKWEERAFVVFSKVKNSNKYTILAFIKSSLKFYFLEARREKQKEISYYELPMRIQQQILSGEYTNE